MNTPAIVIPAYNRPAALLRLLETLAAAWYPNADVHLVISIDVGGAQQAAVTQVATDFVWAHGSKEIIVQPTPLGLIGNVFFCGDLTARYGAIVLLEDDLVVSNAYYHYAMQALAAYAHDPQIGGISLNALWFNGFRQLPFVPYLDASDTFFMQVAWYQGQAYTAEQWQAFRRWVADREAVQRTLRQMHPMYSQFPDTDWFPLKTAWLVDTQRYYVFPRQSLTTNFGETGTHFDTQTAWFQVPMLHARRRYQLGALRESWAVYDSWQELSAATLKARAPRLADYDFTVDLYGTRPKAQITTPYLLGSRPVKQALYSFDATMWPLEENVICNIAGHQLHFALTTNVSFSTAATQHTETLLTTYFNRHRQPSLRKTLSHWLHNKTNRQK